jgi:hypothetical protein
MLEQLLSIANTHIGSRGRHWAWAISVVQPAEKGHCFPGLSRAEEITGIALQSCL